MAGDAGGAEDEARPGDPSSAVQSPARDVLRVTGAATTSTSAVRGRFQPPVLSARFLLLRRNWVRFTTRRLSVPAILTARWTTTM